MSDVGEQLALLKALADRPLTLPPVFVKITGSITAGLLLRQVLYWMGRTADSAGWFYKRLPEFQREMCMTEKEFRTARESLSRGTFLQTERRGSPPTVWFRADLAAVLSAVQKQLKGENHCAESAESIMPKGQNQFRPNAASIVPKGQKYNFAERAKSYKEHRLPETTAETTRAGKPRLSQAERDTWDLRRYRDELKALLPQDGAPHWYLPEQEREEEFREFQRRAAYRAGITIERLQELLRQFFPDDTSIDKLKISQPLFDAAKEPA